MNKDLIELQRNCNVGVIILDDLYKDLGQVLVMDSNIENEYLFQRQGNPIFKEKLDNLSRNGNLTYFVIRNIDEISKENQDRYISLVKDREFTGYNIRDNVIIVFTVKDIDSLKNISNELYHLCVVAM